MPFTFKNFFLSAPLSISILIFFILIVITFIIPKLKRNDDLQKIVDEYIKEIKDVILPNLISKIENLNDNLNDIDITDLERFRIQVENDLYLIKNNVANIKNFMDYYEQFSEKLITSLTQCSQIKEDEKLNLLLEIQNMKQTLNQLKNFMDEVQNSQKRV